MFRKDTKEIENAENIVITVSDRLRVDHAPIVTVCNDMCTHPGSFELNIIYNILKV